MKSVEEEMDESKTNALNDRLRLIRRLSSQLSIIDLSEIPEKNNIWENV